jgi:hypothetical protein
MLEVKSFECESIGRSVRWQIGPLPQTPEGVAFIGDERPSVGLWVTREQLQSDLHSTASGILLLTVGGTPLEAMHK